MGKRHKGNNEMIKEKLGHIPV